MVASSRSITPNASRRFSRLESVTELTSPIARWSSVKRSSFKGDPRKRGRTPRAPPRFPRAPSTALSARPFCRSLRRNSACSTVSVFPTSGPKNESTGHREACGESVAWPGRNRRLPCLPEGKRIGLQGAGTRKRKKAAQSTTVTIVPIQPLCLRLCISALPMLQSPGTYSAPAVIPHSPRAIHRSAVSNHDPKAKITIFRWKGIPRARGGRVQNDGDGPRAAAIREILSRSGERASSTRCLCRWRGKGRGRDSPGGS